MPTERDDPPGSDGPVPANRPALVCPELPDPKEMEAADPAFRWHTVHPELGVVASDDVGRLGVRWLGLPEEEQRLRERDGFAALLRHAAAGGEAVFRLDREDNAWTVAALLALPEVAADESECWGALTGAVIDALATRPCDGLFVLRDGRVFAFESAFGAGPRTDVEVWIDPSQAPALQQELEAAWRPAAEARAAAGSPPAPRDGGRVSRTRRAAILVGWNRWGSKGVILAMVAYADWRIPLTVVNAVLYLCVVIAVLALADKLLKRWHQRA